MRFCYNNVNYVRYICQQNVMPVFLQPWSQALELPRRRATFRSFPIHMATQMQLYEHLECVIITRST